MARLFPVALCLLAGLAASLAGPAKRETTAEDAAAAAATEDPTQPKITYSKETVAKVGDQVKIDCAVEGVDLSGVKDFGVAWSKIDTEKPTNSYPITSGNKVLLFSTKYDIEHPTDSHRYSLIIKSIDYEDTGLYRCTVKFGEDQKIDADVPVNIQRAPFFTDDFTKTLTVTQGDAISIDCQPGGSPKPDVYWERLNQELPYYGGKFFKSNQLDIPLVERDHSGHYVCYADNGIGDPANSHVILEVQYAPYVSVASDRVFVSTNEEASMECTVGAHPESDISWIKDDIPILGSANLKIKTTKVGDSGDIVSTLGITHITPDDFGTYTCRAVNVIGKTERTVELLAKSPPLIVRQSRKEVLYDLESSRLRDAFPVVIECEASGAPTPNYRWTKNGESLVWQADPRISLEEGTGNLLISDPTIKDNGLYQCFAYNDLGTAAGDPVYLLNISRIEFSNDEDPSDTYHVEAELGRPYKLSCPKATGYPKPTLSWVKAVPHEEQIELEFVKEERIVADPEGSLWFTHITEADDTGKNGFQYICLASTEYEPNDYSLASMIELAVKDPADGAHNLGEDALNVESFPMYTSSNTVEFWAGQENTLWCIYGGEPAPKVVWRRTDGQELDDTRIIYKNFGRTLAFVDTKVSDSGEYECAASNGVGDVKTSLMQVTVQQKPTFKNELTSHTVKEGASVTFTCEAEGTGEVKITWMFNGRVLSAAGGHFRRTIHGDKLTITGVTLTDVGNYACNATNEFGYAYDQATLNVLPRGYSYSEGSGLEGLRAEVSALRETVQLILDLVNQEHDLGQETRLILGQIALKLDVPFTKAEDPGNSKPDIMEEEEAAITTLRP